MFDSGSRVLILSPHTDDMEFGCGATVSKIIGTVQSVTSVAFSACEESVPDGYPKDILRQESRAAARALGIPESHTRILDFRVRRFIENRQEILDTMIDIRNSIQPDVVIVPASTDVHQDHQLIYSESLRAFKKSTILGYEQVWNGYSLKANLFIEVTDAHIRTKIAAITEYRSQAGRPYSSGDIITSVAKTRGLQSGLEYAEAFEVVRVVDRVR